VHVNAYAAPAAGEPLAPTTIERRGVGPHDVLIAIEYAGICHSDIHTVRGDCGPQPYPVVPGHEIVGTVAEVGAEVTRHRVGDRVGVGCMVNSCGECASCRNGDEPTRSTRPTSGCLPPTCATGSSSTPRRSPEGSGLGQRRLAAHRMQVRATGRATSLGSPIGPPQRSHVPYVPASTLARAASISVRCSCTWRTSAPI
jgi:hypothetical protein